MLIAVLKVDVKGRTGRRDPQILSDPEFIEGKSKDQD